MSVLVTTLEHFDQFKACQAACHNGAADQDLELRLRGFSPVCHLALMCSDLMDPLVCS